MSPKSQCLLTIKVYFSLVLCWVNSELGFTLSSVKTRAGRAFHSGMLLNTMAGRWEEGDWGTDLKSFYLKVILINSVHMSLAKASYMATPNFKNVMEG